jgi:hypothetical protein
MVKLEFNQPKIKTKQENGTVKVYDLIRRKYVALTPEEMVRQTFIHYLIFQKNVPKGLISVESQLRLFEKMKRTDVVVYTRSHEPWMLIECKSFKVNLSAKEIEQALRYNLALRVPYMILTNARKTLAFKWNDQKDQFVPISLFPDYLD